MKNTLKINKIANYDIVKPLFSSSKFKIYKAVDDKKNDVILKAIPKETLSGKTIASFINEYNIISEFSSQYVAKAIELTNFENAPIMVLADNGGVSLKEIIKYNPNGLCTNNIEKALEIAVLTAKAIDAIHQKNIIHKDINPANIFYNHETNSLNIFDFNLSSKLTYEKQEISNINLLEGTLAYISPEQTGRINRNIDYRSDYYSLGITLYELFSGKLPFEASSPREWVHCQIAKMAVPLHILNEKIPEALSQIVAKLMAKTVEQRYQSSFGIIEDLQTCLKQYQLRQTIELFEIGRKDISQRFRLSQKNYGHDNEINIMMQAFSELWQFNSMMIWVKGVPGIGKSALVGEIYKLITEKNGYFISGKFEHLKKDIPYSAFIDAFSKLFHTLMTEPEDMVEIWRKNILKALAGNGQVIIDVIPNLQQLIGHQASAPVLSAIESQHRFVLTFQNLVEVIALVMHPLVIYLDDMQWADHASIDLLKALVTNNRNGAFLCISAYRQNEVDEGHPLLLMKDVLHKEMVKSVDIELKPWKPDVISRLIYDSFLSSEEKSKELAEICYIKTHGNPFFIMELLKDLYRKEELFYDSKLGCWDWNIDKISKTNVTENVIDLICERIKNFDEKKQNIIKLASCLGSQFDLDNLAVVCETDSKTLAVELHDIIRESLIIPLSNDYRFAQFTENIVTAYKFIHDRVLQAAYSMIDDVTRKIVHLKIARLLQSSYCESELNEKIFVITEHFNKAIDLLTDNERIFLTELNFRSGKKAKNSSAFQQAYNYLEIGISLLPKNSWHLHYKLSLELYSLMAEIAFLCKNRTKMEEMMKAVDENAVDIFDKIDIWELHLLALDFDHQFQQAIIAGLNFLNQLNIKFPKKAGKIDVLISLYQTKSILKKYSHHEILNLPPITDVRVQYAFRIMSMLITPSYYANQKLFPLLAFKFIHLTLKYGLSNLSPIGFISYGMIIHVTFNKVNECYNYGMLGMDILTKLEDKKYWATTSCIFNASIRFWKEPLKSSVEEFFNDYQIALETGNIEYATTSISVCLCYKLFAGEELSELFARFNKYQQFLQQWPKQPTTTLLTVFLQTIIHLQTPKDSPEILIGDKCNEYQIIEENKTVKDNAQMASMYVYKLILAYLFERYNEAHDITKKLSKYIEYIKGLLNYPVFLFFQSLTLLAKYEKNSALRKNTVLPKILANQKKMKKWASIAPFNFLGQYLLVEAEIEKFRKNYQKASEKFTVAINQIKKQGNYNLEALSYELYAKFWIRFRNSEFAKIFILKAYEMYGQWGASAKLIQLENKYNASLFLSDMNNDFIEQVTTNSILLNKNTSDSIDIETLMDSAKTISSEIKLSELLKKSLKIIMVHAGAQNGVIALKDKVNHKLQIEAEGKSKNDEIEICLKQTELSDDKLPMPMIRFVCRTENTVIIGNASQDENYIKCNYVLKKHVKSVLVVPIIHKAELLGILYLENNLATNVFTSKHLTILNLLSSQIGISIGNALLYENMEQIVAQRTEQIRLQNEDLEEANKKVISSINYASKIQHAILPATEMLNTILPENFIIFKPRDIVSGDFYWFKRVDNYIYIAAADCTGHGVPGAFMSMLGIALLNEIVTKRDVNSPNLVLNELRKRLKNSLHQIDTNDPFKDGIDIAFCLIDTEDLSLQFAGAYHSIYLIRKIYNEQDSLNYELIEIKGDKMPIGIHPKDNESFTNQTFQLHKNDSIYLFTDGFESQFGGILNEKFKTKQFKDTLLKIQPLKIKEQKNEMIRLLTDWQGTQEQVDDILVIGLKI